MVSEAVLPGTPVDIGMGRAVEGSTLVALAVASGVAVAQPPQNLVQHYDKRELEDSVVEQNEHAVLGPFQACAKSLQFSPNHNYLHTMYPLDLVAYPKDLHVLTANTLLLRWAKRIFHDLVRCKAFSFEQHTPTFPHFVPDTLPLNTKLDRLPYKDAFQHNADTAF